MIREDQAPQEERGGFTLVELVVVMSVVVVILSIVIPNLTYVKRASQLSKAEGELNTLKTAVTSYWRKKKTYPKNIHTDLLAASPQITPQVLLDPWLTDASTRTYGYIVGSDEYFGTYFAIYTRGPAGDTVTPTWDSKSGRFIYSGSGRVVSNAPVVKK
jgi:prepilin-type N-terminal cleavage/methylation domain-containing protein